MSSLTDGSRGAAARTMLAWCAGAVVLAAACAAYLNTLDGEWVWDDVSSVLLHKHVQEPAKFFQLFREDQHAFGRGQGNFYRPLVAASFMVDYAISGGPSPETVAASGRAYPEGLVRTSHNRAAHATGGRGAFTPNRRDPVVTENALAKVREDGLAAWRYGELAAMQQAGKQQQDAEAWALKHVEQGTIGRLLESASLEQIDRALDGLDSMRPMNTQNEFWTRHELPFDPEPLQEKINAAMDDLIENRRPDAVVAAAFLDLKTGNTNSRERDRQAFDTAADNALGFTLPHDWTGEVRVVGVVERDGEVQSAAVADTPEAYHLYARKGDAQPGEDAFAYLTAPRTLDEADAQVIEIQLEAVEDINIGWGMIGHVNRGSTVLYRRGRLPDGTWVPLEARFRGAGRTLLLIPFQIETWAKYKDYRPVTAVAAGQAAGTWTVEPTTGLEPVTSSLPRKCSTD